MAELYITAAAWEDDTTKEEDRNDLKKFVSDIVGYPCKLACKTNNGTVDIYVFSIKKNKVTDWIEIQPGGAVGVIFDFYDDPDSDAVVLLDVACENHNNGHGLTFESESESDEDLESSKSDSDKE